MRYLLLASLAVVLVLTACDKPAPAKIAAPQREALEKAKGVEQTLKKDTDEMNKKIENEAQ